MAGWVNAEQHIVPGLGALALDTPTQWRIKEVPGPTSIYLEIRPEPEDSFGVQITATWLPQEKVAELPSTLKDRVERLAKGLLHNAVETDVQPVELKGAGNTGYYFSLSARPPQSGSGGYRYLTQGMLATSVGLTVFTLLQRDVSPLQKQQVLEIISNASYSKSGTATALSAQDDVLRIVPQESTYQLWLPTSRLYVDIPKGRLVPARSLSFASTKNPRYFHFVDRGFNVSGWFEPASKFAGIEAFWKTETEGWKKNGLPDAVDVSITKIGPWDAVIYDSPTSAGTNTHMRAHRLQAGTWIDMHLSMVSARSSTQLREALEAYLKGVLVRERP